MKRFKILVARTDSVVNGNTFTSAILQSIANSAIGTSLTIDFDNRFRVGRAIGITLELDGLYVEYNVSR